MSKLRNTEEQQSISNIGRFMLFAMWIGLLGLLSLFFYNWQQKEFNPNQHIQSQVNIQGQTEVVLTANRHRQYITNGFINGVAVVFLVDTGANDISIPEHIAKKIGLKRGLRVQYETANGLSYGYQTKLESVRVGDIQINNIRASINPNVEFDEILLGMTFLKHVELIHKGKTLTLRY